MKFLSDAISILCPGISFRHQNNYHSIKYINSSNEFVPPTEEEINTKIAELEAAEPLRLLRIERNQILQQSDWEVQRNIERNITDSNLIDYRNALRDLPQEIANGNIPAPTLNENGMLVFEHWPTRGEQNA
jgi:hypothetical protein